MLAAADENGIWPMECSLPGPQPASEFRQFMIKLQAYTSTGGLQLAILWDNYCTPS